MFHQAKNRILAAFGLFVLIILLTISPLIFDKPPETKSPEMTDSISEIENIMNISKLTPTPFPFRELTVPYLRSRSFSSNLSTLNKYSENNDYTTYLTSYESDGLKVNGLLTIPRGEMPTGGWPAIVFVHGYIPPTLYQTTQNYVSYIDYLARNGFVVFKIDLRGHDDSEGEAGGAYYSGDYVIDTLSAYESLKSTDFVNKEKIGLWGHSMAGNVTFRSFIVNQHIPAIVIWAGAVYTYDDLQEFRINDNSYRPPDEDSERRRKREELRNLYGDYDKESKFWQMVVPTNYLEGVTGAIQLNHAVNDEVVNIGYSRNLVNVLDDTAITHELIEYPAGGHNLSGSTFNQAMENTVNFFNQYLK